MSSAIPLRRRSRRRILALFVVALLVAVTAILQWLPPVSNLPKGVSTTPPPNVVFTQCAREGGSCSFSGEATVRYGVPGKYHYMTRKNGTACSNEVFGDPAFGEIKNCAHSATK